MFLKMLFTDSVQPFYLIYKNCTSKLPNNNKIKLSPNLIMYLFDIIEAEMMRMGKHN